MQTALALAQVMGPVYILVGLSALIYLKSWQHLLEKLENDHYSIFGLAFMFVILGAISVNMYNVWELNVWLLVTITGWGFALKGAFYFLLPGSAIKKALAIKKQASVIMLGGVLGVVIGAVLTYYAYFA